MESVDDASCELPVDLSGETDPSFSVSDESSANWVVRKITEARAYAERVETWAAAEIGRSEREERWFLSRFGNQLEMWLRGELASKRGSGRSLKLPAGQVGFRSNPAAFTVSDEVALAEWCCWNLQDALRVRIDASGSSACFLRHYLRGREFNLTIRETVSIAEIKKALEATGELPPGLLLTPPSDRFYIK